MEKDYDYAIDIWSIGCIFAELLSKVEGNSYPLGKTFEVKNGPLFPGGSCFPLSPKNEANNIVNNLDQLAAIFQILGTPK